MLNLRAMLMATALTVVPMAQHAFADGEASVAVLKSAAQPFVDTLVLRGRTEANRSVEIKSEIAGLVTSAPKEKGSLVKAGDTLCQIRRGDRDAEMTEAKARLLEAETEFEAAQSLSKKGYASATSAKNKTALLEAAKARVLRAEINLNRLTITAPFDGVLVSDTAELGSLLQNGSVCASLIALDPIKFVAFAPERSVDALKMGAEVDAKLITGRELRGKITYISRSADRDTRTYLVEAETPNEDLSIRDGMTAEMLISLDGVQAHYLPQTALTLDNHGELGVRLAVDNVAKFQSVSVLRDEPRGVWVTGLPETADVIVVGQEFVIDGQKLSVSYVDPEALQ
ncbi:MAG: efflux RND transporter periplasmic adaptor subunit [Pikeienuella sp.]